jgi:uncharacterized protein YqgV (UPF0045/DUF77 family)
MAILAQVSIYPLRQTELTPAIDSALEAFEKYKILFKKGEMSTLLEGEPEQIFKALQAAFEKADEVGDLTMVITLSNACPFILPQDK